jgi:holin-like protein
MKEAMAAPQVPDASCRQRNSSRRGYPAFAGIVFGGREAAQTGSLDFPATQPLSGTNFRSCLRDQWWVSALGFIAIWAICETAATHWGLPIPGGIIGLGVVLLALEMGWVSRASLQRGASSLLGNLVLFFVPAMLGVVEHRELVSIEGIKLLAAVLIGTPMVMIGTAAVVELGFRLRKSREH